MGGIEAEAVMLGQSISMVLPLVVGYKISGQLGPLTTSTDVVLTITKVCVGMMLDSPKSSLDPKKRFQETRCIYSSCDRQ